MSNIKNTQPCDLLVIGTSKDNHINRVVQYIDKSVSIFRLDIDRFPTEISIAFKTKKADWSLLASDVKSKTIVNLAASKVVWFRRIGMPTIEKSILQQEHRQFALSEVEHFIGSFPLLLNRAQWVSDFYATKSASIKPYQLKIANEIGLDTPETIITNSPEAALDSIKSWGSSIYKTMSTPSINYKNGRSIIYTKLLSPKDLEKIDGVRCSPSQFQENIVKKIELRITYIGGEIFPVAIYSQDHDISKIDWRAGIGIVKYERFEIPIAIKILLLELMERLGLKYGAIDMIVTDEDRYVFLEVNPHGAWGWIEDEAKLNMSEKFGKYLSKLCLE